jgi:hypothetical protein
MPNQFTRLPKHIQEQIDAAEAKSKRIAAAKEHRKKKSKQKWELRKSRDLARETARQLEMAKHPKKPNKKARIPYRQYLKTPWWKSRRKRAIRDAGRKCNRCGRSYSLQVHHLNYANLWNEPKEDLEVLCRPCHKHEHQDAIDADSHMRQIAGQCPPDLL